MIYVWVCLGIPVVFAIFVIIGKLFETPDVYCRQKNSCKIEKFIYTVDKIPVGGAGICRYNSYFSPFKIVNSEIWLNGEYMAEGVRLVNSSRCAIIKNTDRGFVVYTDADPDDLYPDIQDHGLKEIDRAIFTNSVKFFLMLTKCRLFDLPKSIKIAKKENIIKEIIE